MSKITNTDKSKGWFTKGLSNACKKKNALYRAYLQSKTKDDEQRYKTYKNRLTSILRRAEKDYYENLIDSAKGDIKKTWKTLNSIIRPNSQSRAGNEYKDMLKNDNMNGIVNDLLLLEIDVKLC